jgi:hypothetical protein
VNDQRGTLPSTVFPCFRTVVLSCFPSHRVFFPAYARRVVGKSRNLTFRSATRAHSSLAPPCSGHSGTLKTPRIRFASSFFAASAIAVLRGSDRRAC